MRSLALLLILLLPLSHASGHGGYHDELLRIARELETRPDDGSLLGQRALLHLGHEDWQAALTDLERVDRLLGDSSNTNGLRGQALNLAGQWAAARAVLTRHLEKHPQDGEAWFHRGRAARHLGDLPQAVADYRTALARDEGLSKPEQVGEIAEAMVRLDGAAAGAVFLDQSITRLGADPSLLQQAIVLHIQAGQVDAALVHLSALQKLMPRPEPMMARRARILALAQRDSEAQAAWSALHTRLLALPNLERGIPELTRLLQEAQQALGLSAPAPVIAAPAAATSRSPHSSSLPQP
jgi:tetratricopeptide (TPR) repeat protein